VAGFGITNVPQDIKLAIMRTVKYHYDYRDDVESEAEIDTLPTTAKTLLKPYFRHVI